VRDEQVMTLPSVFVIMMELDRVEKLQHKIVGIGVEESELGRDLRYLLSYGPARGIHFVLSFSGFYQCINVIHERNALPHIRHRVGLQMAEDDSRKLLFRQHAATLQSGGEVPVCALYVNTDSNNTLIRFKPYTVESKPGVTQASLIEQVTSLGQVLEKRRSYL